MEFEEKFEGQEPQMSRRFLLLGGAAVLLAPVLAFCVDRISNQIPNPPNAQPPVQQPVERHEGVEHADSPELQKLAEYERTYGTVTDELMIFSDTPDTSTQATEYAASMSAKLKEFAKYDVAPLVVFEPIGSSGPLDLVGYADGQYDIQLNEYFTALKAGGVTDDMMGTWVLFAEANTPAWQSTTEPTVISRCITRTAEIVKQHFAGARLALLLDSKTYAGDDALWEHGEYKSLVPYVADIPDGLIDRFGLQGFPWASPANQPQVQQFDPGLFVNTDLATEAAAELGVDTVWFNTGTFAQMYAQQSEQTISASPRQRQELLDGIMVQMQKAKQAGYAVSVNIFSANKSQVGEAIDWSYERSDADRELFRGLLSDLRQADISLSVFDSADPR